MVIITTIFIASVSIKKKKETTDLLTNIYVWSGDIKDSNFTLLTIKRDYYT